MVIILSIFKMENSTNNSWGWFVDIEAPLYSSSIHKQYIGKATLPTISEVPRNKLTEIFDFEDEFVAYDVWNNY